MKFYFRHITLHVLLLAFLATPLYGQEEGAVLKSEKGPFLLKGGTLVTVSQGVLEATDLLIDNGRIERIGKDLPEGDVRVIDCTGKFVYPGFIDSGTRLGLVEVNSLEETRDYQEIGHVTPNMQTLIAVNPNAVAIPVTRVSGVTTTLALPSGGLFPGTTALIHLDGYTPEQMYAGFKGVMLAFPNTGRTGPNDNRNEETVKKEANEAIQQLDEVWKNAVRYAHLTQAGAKLEYFPEMAQLARVVRGEMPLIIEVNTAADILRAIDWTKEKHIQPIFSGVAEGWRVADSIAEAGIPVITGPVLALPTRHSDRYDVSYANAGKLAAAGVKVALRTNEAENVRNLPFHAGFAAAYGLGGEEALKAVTINAAEIFGLEKEIGSLEEGKLANLFVADGDPFEPKTQIPHVFIQGYRVPITNRQIRLYQEFIDRTPGLSR
ncbi:putative amidohydrolase [Lunatimonas lonarensis]|uniref:Putative amidohydrolase n=1 Tax=Lunatimonas lonarensis TaxID=1232681 RepID=R7ZVN5_9BACT|nr:amidohydrolase family protein [Lunatimonas lonarensis]EON78205.1 putative amidohydrolase [Lunatimonas lonarensis]